MKKRMLSFLLAVSMLASMVSALPVAAGAVAFTPSARTEWNGHTYYFYEEYVTWHEAKAYCEDLGGHLATFTSEEEWKVIHEKNIELGDYFWLGGYGAGDLDSWQWITGETWSYSDWCYGEPNNDYDGTENYLGTYTGSYQWNDYRPEETLGFICEVEEGRPESRIELSSTRPALYVSEGETFQIAADVYAGDVLTKGGADLSVSIEDEEVARITGRKVENGSLVLDLLAEHQGTTTLRVSDLAAGVTTTAVISVTPKHKNAYTIYNVPEQDLIEGTILGHDFITEDNNLYFAGIFVDSFEKTVHDDGSCTLSFHVYNTNQTYGMVEVYDQNGDLYNAQVIDKQKSNNTSIKEALWDNACCFIQDIAEGNLLSYRQSSEYSQKTSVRIENIPAGGYIKITMDSRESLLLCIINEMDIVLSTQDVVEKIAGFGNLSDVKFFQNVADRVVKDKSDLFRKVGSQYRDELLEGIGEEFSVNASTIGNFANTLKRNLSTLEWEELAAEAAVDCGVSGAESAFQKAAGPAGWALAGCFAIGSTTNLILECHSFVELMGTSSVSIQVPADASRTYNRVHVQCQESIDRNTALEAYTLEETDLDLVPEEAKRSLARSVATEYMDISMVRAGQETPLTSPATVSIPLSERMKEHIDQIKVFRVEPDGSLTQMKASPVNWLGEDYMRFETDHFSLYAIAVLEEEDAGTTSFGSPVSEWAKGEVEEAYQNDLVPEVLIGKDLTQKVDRAEFAAIAVALYENLSGEQAAEAGNPFYDIAGNPCASDILKAYHLDITAGTTTTTFSPDQNITREQMAAMLTRAYKKSEFPNWSLARDSDYPLNFMGVPKFADDDKISAYAKESVYFLTRWDVIQGVGENKFAPKNDVALGEAYGYATREQALIIALRSEKYL